MLGCAGIAIAMGRFLMTMLRTDPALYLTVTFIGSVAFLALLGSIILFLGEECQLIHAFVWLHHSLADA